MNPKEIRERVFSNIKERYLTDNKTSGQFSGLTDAEEQQMYMEALKYYGSKGYIKPYFAIGMMGYTLIEKGIDFIESSSASDIRHDALTGTFASIVNEIAESPGIPEEHKALIASLIEETLQSKEKSVPASRVKDFLVSISSGTISDAAVNSLSIFFQALLSRM